MTICAERPNAERVALAGELRKLLAEALVRDFRERLLARRAEDGDRCERAFGGNGSGGAPVTPSPNGKGPNARGARRRTGKPGQRQRLTEAQLADRRHEALKLFLAGVPYRSIAKHLGISVQRAHNDVRVALAERASERRADAEFDIQLELARLDAAQVHIWKGVQTGSPAAIASFCRLSERRCRLLGLDKPSQVAVTGELGLRPYKDMDRADIKQRLVAAVLRDPEMRSALASRLATIEPSATTDGTIERSKP